MPFCTPVLPSVSNWHLVTPPHSHSGLLELFHEAFAPFQFSVLHLELLHGISFITSFLLSSLNNLFNSLLQFVILLKVFPQLSVTEKSLVVLPGLWGFNYLWPFGVSLFCPYHSFTLLTQETLGCSTLWRGHIVSTNIPASGPSFRERDIEPTCLFCHSSNLQHSKQRTVAVCMFLT